MAQAFHSSLGPNGPQLIHRKCTMQQLVGHTWFKQELWRPMKMICGTKSPFPFLWKALDISESPQIISHQIHLCRMSAGRITIPSLGKSNGRPHQISNWSVHTAIASTCGTFDDMEDVRGQEWVTQKWSKMNGSPREDPNACGSLAVKIWPMPKLSKCRDTCFRF